jgi:hypothetical protein
MKYVHKNQNHRAFCYYAMNNHMYLVKDPELVKFIDNGCFQPNHENRSILDREGCAHGGANLL